MPVTRRALGDVTAQANNVRSPVNTEGKSLRTRATRAHPPAPSPSVASPEVKQCLTSVFGQQLENTPETQQRDMETIPRRHMAKSPLHPSIKPEMPAKPAATELERTVQAQIQTQSVGSIFERLQSLNATHMILALAAFAIVGLVGVISMSGSAAVPQDMHRFDLAVPAYDERLPVEAFKQHTPSTGSPAVPTATFAEPPEGFRSSSGDIYVEYGFSQTTGSYTHNLVMKSHGQDSVVQSRVPHTRGVFAFNLPRPAAGEHSLFIEVYDEQRRVLASASQELRFTVA